MDKDPAPTNNIGDDAYRAFESQLREESKEVNVSIRSPYLLDEDITSLTSEIQQKIREDLAKNNEAKLQSFKEQLQASKKSLQRSPIEESLPSPIEEGEVNIRLEALNLPEENKNRLTSEIQKMIEEKLARNPEASRVAGRTCICATVGGPPGTEQRINLHIPLREPNNYHIEFNGTEDSFRMVLSPQDKSRINELVVSLKTRLYSNWSKEIWAYDACRPSHPGVGLLRCVNNNTGWQQMRLYRRCEGGQTLVFRKPKEFGIYHDIYHLFRSPNEFWNFFGGRRVSFRWDSDHRGDPWYGYGVHER